MMLNEILEVHEEGSCPLAMTPQTFCCYLMFVTVILG